MITVDIDQKQLQEILRKADPAMVTKEIDKLIKDTAHRAQISATSDLRGGTEQAGHSMHIKVWPLGAVVASSMPKARALSIEEGRKPGETAPYMQIARWATGRRYLTRRRVAEMAHAEKAELDAQTLPVIDAIKSSGVKGKWFMRGAKESALHYVQEKIQAIAQNIEGRWKK